MIGFKLQCLCACSNFCMKFCVSLSPELVVVSNLLAHHLVIALTSQQQMLERTHLDILNPET